MKLSDEFLLAAACCRWPPGETRERAVQAAAGREIDWQRLVRIARRQRVEGLVSDALVRARVNVPAEVSEELSTQARKIAQQNLVFAAESRRLQAMFEESGLTFLFVKGVTLDILAYGSLGLKKARDIDMVVAPESLAPACVLLAEAGYERILPGAEVGEDQFQTWLQLCKETSWRHAHSGIIVELHNGLVDNPALLPGIDAHSPLQSVDIAPGIRLSTLAMDELFAYLCVHGATHAWSRMKWIADVAALLSAAGMAEVERLHRRSLDLGVGRCSGQALLLCETLFGFELPSGLSAQLRADASLRRLVRIALAAMGGRNVETELDDTVLGTVPIHLSHFLLAPGWRYKVSEARRKSLSHQDRATIPLPRGLHFLYPLLLVPSWLWRRVRGPSAL